jgi:phosphoenolpyruvate-protein phosphotransferase (PTS system enzyme I)
MKSEPKPSAKSKRRRKVAEDTTPRETGRKEIVLGGLGVSAGIAIGAVHLVEIGAVQIPEYDVPESEIEAELTRFSEALTKSERQLKKLKSKSVELHGAAAEELGFLLEAHMQMLSGSRVVRGVEARIRRDRINAEAAVQAAISAVAEEFEALDDPYVAARAADVREVGNRLLRNLTKTPYEAFKHLPEGAIVIAEELTPADTALLDPRHVAGFATALGGAQSHTAIMARSLELPAVLGIPDLLTRVKNGDGIIIDGYTGRVVIRPTRERLAEYQRRIAHFAQETQQLAGLRRLPSMTTDGRRIGLFANLELPREVDNALQAGAAGVGLLRTEFLYMNRPDLPDEDEQYEILREIVERMSGRPVTVRTLDIGNDKHAPALKNHIVETANPALGLRAIRLSLRHRDLLDAQLGAILRAGVHGPVRILLPMISNVGEMRQTRAALDQVARRLKRRGVKIAEPLPALGAMIEIPGAALAADALAQSADFFAVGSNDLTMYTLAIDRGEEQVAHLYNPLHPAVLRLIQFAAEAALRARIPISVCGEIAGDPKFVPLLLGLGIQELSMAVSNIPRIKQRVRSLDFAAAARCARTIMDQTDSGRIAALLDDFNALAM